MGRHHHTSYTLTEDGLLRLLEWDALQIEQETLVMDERDVNNKNI
jgi:hypothetical protein